MIVRLKDFPYINLVGPDREYKNSKLLVQNIITFLNSF